MMVTGWLVPKPSPIVPVIVVSLTTQAVAARAWYVSVMTELPCYLTSTGGPGETNEVPAIAAMQREPYVKYTNQVRVDP